MCKFYRIVFFVACMFALVGCGDESSSPDPVDFNALCPNDARGTVTDERDGREYAYTTIGNQTWMAENLKYNLKYSTCYDSISENCEKDGRLYVFQNMEYNLLGRVTERNFIWDSVYTLCPKGWRVPKVSDFEHLREQVQADALALISKEHGGSDLCGFNLKLAGEFSYRGDYTTGKNFYGQGEQTSLFTQTRDDYNWAYIQNFNKATEMPEPNDRILIFDPTVEGKVTYMGYVRCVKE